MQAKHPVSSLTPPLGALGLGLLLLAGGAGCSSIRNAGSTDLFNGRDLAGWRHVLADPAVKPEAVWTVRDGIIHCKGDPIGFLYSDRSFTDFHLVVEYRWAPGAKPGNSGIFSRLDRPSPAVPRTIEVQLAHGSAGDVMGLQGLRIDANQPRYFHVDKHAVAGDIDGVRKLENAERPAGDWNHLEIEARGGSYRVELNGRTVNEVKGVHTGAGTIGLQSEGGEVQFRRVTIRPL